MNKLIDRMFDPFFPERDTFFQVYRVGPRCSEISVALPHSLAFMGLLTILLTTVFTS